MTNLDHAGQRVTERLIRDAGLPEDIARKVYHCAKALEQETDRDSEAVRLFCLAEQVNEDGSDYHGRTESNGSQVWAIYRGQFLATVMLRRDNQPSTEEALRVSKVRVIN